MTEPQADRAAEPCTHCGLPTPAVFGVQPEHAGLCRTCAGTRGADIEKACCNLDCGAEVYADGLCGPCWIRLTPPDACSDSEPGPARAAAPIYQPAAAATEPAQTAVNLDPRCPACDGAGALRVSGEPCPVCRGAGVPPARRRRKRAGSPTRRKTRRRIGANATNARRPTGGSA